MRVLRCALLPIFVVGLSGCIPLFLHAGYTAKDVVVDTRLVGTWIETDHSGSPFGPDSISFQLEGDKGYRTTYFQRGEDPDSLVFLGHLFRVGAVTLIDLEPHPSSVVSAYYLPAHTFWRADLSGDTLVWGGLDESWTVAAAKRAGIGCPVDTVQWKDDQNVVLTCGTPTVRRLLAAAAADPKALWSEAMVRPEVDAKR